MIETTTKEQHDKQTESPDTLKLLLASTLVDHFDPMTFGKELVEQTTYEQALAVLSESCEEIEHDGNWHWRISQELRRDLLIEHHGSDLFEQVIAQVAPREDDLFARYLRKGIDGKRLTDELNAKSHAAIDFNALLKAARLVDLLGIPASDGSQRGKDNGSGDTPSEARQIRRFIEKKSAMDSLGSTSADTLFGRFRDIRKLIEYRNSNLIDARNHALPLCVIVGVGGIGKSALLARYIARQRKRSDQAAVIHFDFDRSSLKPDDPLALTFEFTRQLALYKPELDLPLVRFRRSLRTPEALDIAAKMPDRALTDALAILGKTLADWPERTSGITIVIDTFEEVALRGNYSVKKTLAWLTYLRNLVHLDNLHIIIAGREMPDSILSVHKPHIHCRIRLTDLHKGAAQLMLTHLGIADSIARKAVSTFGGNPLVLRMFVRFSQNKPEEIDALLADSRNHKRSTPTGELAITFLFERILVRISDEQIRKLTSPGLILRHITADLIQKVLAQACELGSLDKEQSQALFNRLAEHVWLVRQEGDRLLSHRRDLRKLMLSGIKKAHESTFEEINRLAVRYYTSEPLPEGVSPEEAWIEAAYHRGFLTDNSIPDNAEDRREIITQLGSDLLDWPVHTTALIKHNAMPERLTTDEKRYLEAHHGLTSRANQAAHLEHNEPSANSETARNNHTIDASQPDTSLLYPEIQGATTQSIKRYFKHGQFDHVSPLAARILKPLFRERDALDITHYWQDKNLLGNTPWLVALSVLAEPDSDRDTVPIISTAALDTVQATPRRVNIDTAFDLFYLLAIAKLMQDRLAVESLSSYLKNHLPCFAPPINHAAQLQVLQLCVKAMQPSKLIGDRDIVSITDCDMLQWRSIYRSISENTHPDTRTNRARLEVIRKLLPEGDQQPSLKQLNTIRSTLKTHAIEVLGPNGLDGLHSMQPVLHSPICFALASVPAQHIHRALSSAACESSPWWPADFISAKNSLFSSEKTLDTRVLRLIVDSADRSNLLVDFLHSLTRLEHDPLLKDEFRLLQKLHTQLTGEQPE